jgi:hypothetical protein
MKYINHMTSSHDDEKHQAAMDRAGLEVYGAYWIICEKIAAQIRPECVATSLQFSWKSWGSKLQVDPRVARRLIRVMGEVKLAIVKETDSGARVDIPNLLKYGDEYTKKVLRKSGQAPDNVPTNNGSPAVPAVPDKQDLKPGPVEIVDNSAKDTGADARGGLLEAPPRAAPVKGTRRARAPDLEPGRMTPEELIAAARITGEKQKAT